ncbi:twin-arginine translocation signal domain-containing protein [Haladaptatus sp. NG-SE-30]
MARETDNDKPLLNRRSYLKTAGAVTAAITTAGLTTVSGIQTDTTNDRSSVITNGTPIEQITWEVDRTWRDVFPEAFGLAETPALSLYRWQMDAQPFRSASEGTGNMIGKHLLTGTDIGQTIEGGTMTIANRTGRFEAIGYEPRCHPIAPFFSGMLRVEEYSGTPGTSGEASNAGIGLIKDDTNYLWVGSNVAANQMQLFEKLTDSNGATHTNTVPFDTDYALPSAPFDLYVIFQGDCVSCLAREDGDNKDWKYYGDAHIGNAGVARTLYDIFDKPTWEQFNPYIHTACGGNNSITLSDFELFYSYQLGVRGPFPVTYKNGAPLIKNGKLYCALTPGSIKHRGFQTIATIDLETFEIEMQSVLFAEAKTGYLSNYVASHVIYDDSNDTFTVMWSGFGNGPNDPKQDDGFQRIWVTHTEKNVLDGTHLLEAVDSNLPRNPAVGNGGYHDFNGIYDEQAGKWRAVYNSGGIDEVSIAETTDESLTGGWTVLDSHQDPENQIEGGRIVRVNGEYKVLYADPTVSGQMVSCEYPTVSTNRTGFDLDVDTNDEAPHPSVVPVRSGGETTYKLITMDETKIYDKAETSHGSLWMYEAVEQADGYEFPERTASTFED